MNTDEKLLPVLNGEGLALDIDETLSYTIYHWVLEMQELFGNPENLTPEELISKYRYTQNVPYWQTPEALEWTEDHRNSDEFQTKLPLIADADIYVKKIHKIMPIVAYISIRPDIVMSGTKNWLDKHKFPEAPIICRPKDIPTEKGSEWKAAILEKLYPKVKGIIDDNASVMKFFGPNYAGTIFLFNHKQTIAGHIKNIPCKDWPTTYEKVKDIYAQIKHNSKI